MNSDGDWRMPNLYGLTAREVMELFSGKEFRLRLRGSGLVRAQQPSSGALLKKGEPVLVHLDREVSGP
jgi:hypothetical protein